MGNNLPYLGETEASVQLNGDSLFGREHEPKE